MKLVFKLICGIINLELMIYWFLFFVVFFRGCLIFFLFEFSFDFVFYMYFKGLYLYLFILSWVLLINFILFFRGIFFFIKLYDFYVSV